MIHQFELGKAGHQVRVWRTHSEEYAQQFLTPTFKTTWTSVMVWGGITWDKRSQLVIIKRDRRTSTNFVEDVYNGHLATFLEQFDAPILMEDGAPIHRAAAATNWRNGIGLDKLIWPPQSPDSNPIENVWKIMKDTVQKKI
jgi:hypothetical protein